MYFSSSYSLACVLDLNVFILQSPSPIAYNPGPIPLTPAQSRIIMATRSPMQEHRPKGSDNL